MYSHFPFCKLSKLFFCKSTLPHNKLQEHNQISRGKGCNQYEIDSFFFFFDTSAFTQENWRTGFFLLVTYHNFLHLRPEMSYSLRVEYYYLSNAVASLPPFILRCRNCYTIYACVWIAQNLSLDAISLYVKLHWLLHSDKNQLQFYLQFK